MSNLTHSMRIIKTIDQFKQMMPSRASIEFFLHLSDLINDIFPPRHLYDSYKGKLPAHTALTELLNSWCQNLLEAGYDSPEIRICALEDDPIIFNLCKKIVSDLEIKILDEPEHILLVIVLEILYSNPRDCISIFRSLSDANYYLDYALDNEQTTSLSTNLIEIHKEIITLEHELCRHDDDYVEMIDSLNNYANPQYKNYFYIRNYSEQELKNKIFNIERETFHRNDQLIEHLIAIMSQNMAKLEHPALRVM